MVQNNVVPDTKADILIVDDTPENLRLLNQILSQGYKVRLAPNGMIGLAAARSAPPDIILLDIMMPTMNGFEVIAQLKADPLTADIPVIFMSALDDTASKVRGFSAGGIDYVTKPFQEVEVLARVKTHLAMRTLYKQAQTELSERRRVEKDLRESEGRLRALLSAVPDTMYRLNREGTVLDFKASADGWLLAPPEQLLGASLPALLDEHLAGKFMNCINAALACRETQTLQYTLKIGDASRVFEARFKDSGPTEVTAIVRDVSGWVRLEQLKSDFINRASHELRTPITTMVLMVDLIDGGGVPESMREYWGVLKDEINREQRLVENLLTVGRMESEHTGMRMVMVDMTRLLDKVLGQFSMSARDKEIRLTLENLLEANERATVRGDENSLTQVFVNLVSNALKFTPRGGEAKIVLRRRGANVVVEVRDNGIGIPSDDLPLLFTRFFRGSNAIENEIPGTGVGLFIVQTIVEKLGGKVKVSSMIEHGSQFEVWLPVAGE